jgi:hypothetical protein
MQFIETKGLNSMHDDEIIKSLIFLLTNLKKNYRKIHKETLSKHRVL